MFNDYDLKLKDLKSKIQEIEYLLKPKDIADQKLAYEMEFDAINWINIETDKLQRYIEVKNNLESWDAIQNLYDEAILFLEYVEEDAEALELIASNYEDLLVRINELKTTLMFTGKYDKNNAILSIHAGAGGKEAQDWCRMLMEMYLGWANKHNCKTEVIDWQDGEDASVLKSISIRISGVNVYGFLKNESGVHRLVRVSPYDSQNRRHTSFAAVEVLPEIEADCSVELDMKDLRIDTFRSSGAGGQHVNKTESAIRITHIPTGIVVSCQQERSQYKNKDMAMKILLSKLITIKEEEHLNEISQIQGIREKIEWGNQIRSYVFMPYQMVKDHRTNYETGNIASVMAGNIDDFILSNLA
jgi:peptide chain release factor 2